MLWFAFVAGFALGFAAGAWRGGKRERRLAAAALALPLIIFLLTGLMVLHLRLTAPPNQGMNDLAYIATATIGTAMSLLAFAGGLFGVWFRRAGEPQS